MKVLNAFEKPVVSSEKLEEILTGKTFTEITHHYRKARVVVVYWDNTISRVIVSPGD